MDKRRLFIVLLLFVSLFLCADEPDLIMSGPDAGPVRVSRAVIEQAYNNIGLEVEFTFLPAERSLVETNKGTYDGEIMRVSVVSDLYKNLIKIPVPIYHIKITVITRDDIQGITKWDDLKPYLIGIRRGVKIIEIRTGSMRVYVGNTVADLIKLLKRKRIDCIVVGELQALKFSKEMTDNNIVIHKPPLEMLPAYHFVHKKNAKIVPLISDELRRMEQAGEIELIRQREIEKILNK